MKIMDPRIQWILQVTTRLHSKCVVCVYGANSELLHMSKVSLTCLMHVDVSPIRASSLSTYQHRIKIFGIKMSLKIISYFRETIQTKMKSYKQ